MGLADTRTNRTTSRLANTAASTPGPWFVSRVELDDSDWPDDGFDVVANNNKTVCRLFEHMGASFDNFENDEANALLIAAAPDMLAALKRCVEAFGHPDNDWSAIEQARAAIAKAEAVGDRTAPAKTGTGE